MSKDKVTFQKSSETTVEIRINGKEVKAGGVHVRVVPRSKEAASPQGTASGRREAAESRPETHR